MIIINDQQLPIMTVADEHPLLQLPTVDGVTCQKEELAKNRSLNLLKSTSEFVDGTDAIGKIGMISGETSPTLFQEFSIIADIKKT